MEYTNAAQETLSKKSQRRASFSPMKAIRSLSVSSQKAHLSPSTASDVPNDTGSSQKRAWRKSVSSGVLAGGNLIRNDSKSSNECSIRRGSTSTRRTTPSMTSRGTSLYEDIEFVIKSGPLHPEPSLLKSSKKEYLVLTPTTLFKFKSYSIAAQHFPMIYTPEDGGRPVSFAESHSSFKDLTSSAEISVPLEKVVSVFKDEGTGPSFGFEIWWESSDTTYVFASLGLEFDSLDERDDWLQQIRLAIGARETELGEERASPTVEFNISSILQSKYRHMRVTPVDIYPVIPRRPYAGLAGEVKKNWRESSSFYLAFTKYSIFLVQFSRLSNGQKVNPNLIQFGLVNFSHARSNANDERFNLIFRLPFEQPMKLHLSSRYCESIISRLFRADMYLKPSWPLWTRRAFHVDDATQRIPLPNGEDYGGFRTTLEAFIEAYNCPPVEWTVKWKGVRYAPQFCLLKPKHQSCYSPHQLLAVFHALRFNESFHGISFRDIDFSSLVNKFDNTQRLEPTIWLSRTGKRGLACSEVSMLESASVLFQELVSILLGSEAIKYIDMTNVLRKAPTLPLSHNKSSPSTPLGICEIVPPVAMLWRSLQTRCNAITLNGNVIGETDAIELRRVFQNRSNFLRALEISRCNLSERLLVYLFEGLYEQRDSLEELDTSHNSGRIEASKVAYAISEASKLKRLNLAYTIRGDLEGPLFRPWSCTPLPQVWRLEELDLSGWKLNCDTIRMIMEYLVLDESKGLRRLSLNNCGLTGELATGIFCRIGAGRDLHLSLNGNPLEEESTAWIDLIHANQAPTKLHLDMIQFQHASNFNKLLTALSHNKTIVFLSMAGTGPPDRVTLETSGLLSMFFRTNNTLKYLDLSGYSGKLEDGELGWGLSTALSGLSSNMSLRQLRLRNHDLGADEDLTELCRTLAVNKGLAMLDIRNNNFDHHQFDKLVHALGYNQQIISFPISEADRAYAISKEKRLFLESQRTPFTKRHDRLTRSTEKHLDNWLTPFEEHWDSETEKVKRILARNREYAANQALELETEYLEAWDDSDLPRWLAHRSATRQQQDRSKRRASEPIIMPPGGRTSLREYLCPDPPVDAQGLSLRRASYPFHETYVIEEET
ncbi:RNI-like protein [Xylaria nigripes]|nr:RNI-like protein [Xylaria nigripes]